MWIPEDQSERKHLLGLLHKYSLPMVCHQFQPNGNSINAYCRSFEYYLNLALEYEPVLVNSQSGKDYFTLDEQLKVVDLAQEFSVRNNIGIVHETHRGCMNFSPYNAMDLFRLRPLMRITADFSHWVCVTESYLENCTAIMNEAMRRTWHIHARIGHTEGPQVPDPRAKEWQEAVDICFKWWDKIIQHRLANGEDYLTITPEFGPPPYMTTLPDSGKPISDQFEINNYMKSILRNRYDAYNK